MCRGFLKCSLLVSAALGLLAEAVVAEVRTVHALAMHGEPKYPADFTHFEYLNPDAPKGGEIRVAARGTFDSFNGYIAKGNPGPGASAETLLISSADEPFTEYGLIAESIEVPEDRSWVAFSLRPQARWHDGQPITVEDVIWSLETLKSKGRPRYRFYYKSIESAEKIGPHKVKFHFNETGNRELPLIVGQLPILPKHYWETRDFSQTTLEPPLSSGPYKVAKFEAGRYVVLQRVEDYWGKDLAVNRGQNNFDRIRIEYFRDATVIREALKAGEIDYFEENTAKEWATGYNIVAVEQGWLVKEEILHQRPTGMQAFVFNTRRKKFADPKLRLALAYAFDFEWSNRNLFFGQYARTNSYFSNSELASCGLPQGEELEILQRYRGQIPDAVFEQQYQPPATDGAGWPRHNLRRAFALLDQAGWEVRNHKLVSRTTGEPLSFEVLLVTPAFERVVLPFARNLKRLGIEVSVRLVDSSQYVNRLRSFDFDIVVSGWGQSESPGNEQRSYWGSTAADSPAARNLAGIKDPVIDELIELIIKAPSRDSLVARTRALDRVLLWGHYVIPNWHLRKQRLLYWDKFSRPSRTTKYGTSYHYWWFDARKASSLAAAREAGEIDHGDGVATSQPTTLMTLAMAATVLVVGLLMVRRYFRKSGISAS